MTATAQVNGKAPSNDRGEINRALDLFHGHGVIELRHIGPGWKGRKETNSGYFDDFDRLASEAESCRVGNCYLTLNPVDSSLLARRANRVEVAGDDATTKDHHVSRRLLLLVDFDALRPTGISSSDEEHEAAIDRAKRAARAMVDVHKFPMPVLADSGNGAHLLFRVDLPNNPDSALLAQRFLARMHELFSDDIIGVDQSVYNAARITKLYGTVARKGDHCHDRPHRLSRLLYVPEPFEVVGRELLEQFAGPAEQTVEKPKTQASAAGSFAVEEFVSKHLEVLSHGPHSDTHGAVYRWKLASCPFCGESDKSAVVLKYDSGRLGYKCHHNRCFGIGWQELREHFEPGYRDRWRDETTAKAERQGMPDLRPKSERDVPQEPIVFQRITCAELAGGDYALEYLIEGTMVAGQPLIIAGPQKTLKTSFIIDAAVSLATGGHFLGRLKVPNSTRVAVMSGESGLGTIQETAFRVAAAAGWHLADIGSLIWSPDIPRFGDAAHLAALERFLQDDEIAVLFIDPAYLCLPSQDSGNLIAQGELLRSMTALCQRMGVTMVLAHHTKKNTLTPKDDPPELSDIAWAGFAEFARQWWLIGRREKYEPGSGEHRLWLSVGGSAGHSALWGVDVSEGVYSPDTPRRWDVTVQKGCEVLTEKSDDRAEKRKQREELKAAEQAQSDARRVVEAMVKLGKPETQSQISAVARISSNRTKAAIADLLADGAIREAGEIVKANRQPYQSYAICEGSE